MKKYCVSLILVCFIISSCKEKPDNRHVLKGANQLIVVLNEDWDSTAAKIYLLEKANETWVFDGEPIDGVIGNKGIGWGVGLHDGLGWEERFPYLNKVEGDKRNPGRLIFFRQRIWIRFHLTCKKCETLYPIARFYACC
jgi:hypothetical protein